MTINEKLKKILVEELNLEDVKPEEIDDNAPIFGDEGLGLDSLDAFAQRPRDSARPSWGSG